MAYGARLESVLGASPRGFESPILRHRTPEPAQVPGFLLPLASLVLLVVPLVFWAPSGPAAREIATRELRSARRLEARPGPAGLAAASNRAGLVAVNGQAPPPPTGTAAGPSGALHTGGTCGAVCPGRQSGGPALLSPGLVP